MGSEAVWYVAYGSNLSAARLQRYLDRCDTNEPPVDRRAMVLPHRLVFARSSRLWDHGGVAFVDPEVDPDAGTLATAWLVGRDQFLQVLAQENGMTGADAPVGELPGPGESVEVYGGWYGLVLGVTPPDDRLAYTFTTGSRPLPVPTRPSAGYVATIVDGLVEGHGRTLAEARDYLAARGA